MPYFLVFLSPGPNDAAGVWQLVGLDPDAVEPELRQRSDDFAREL